MLEVLSFGFAPMKGTRHVPQRDAHLTSHGAIGDRCLCLVDLAQQKVLHTVAHPQLLALKVTWEQGLVRVQIPGQPPYAAVAEAAGELVCDYWGRGVKLQVLDSAANRMLSSHLGKEVYLAQAETGCIIFGAPYSLIGSASLEYLAGQVRRPELVAEHARLRPTLLVKTAAPFEEDGWTGQIHELFAGEGAPQSLTGVRLKIGEGIGRCAVIDFNPVTGEKDLPLFKQLMASRPRNERGEPTLGVFAQLAAL